MRISLIVAMDRHALIGTKDGLPWHLPADLERFRRITTGKTVIMGRATHEHIGRPLSDRFNIVLSRRQDYSSPGLPNAPVGMVMQSHDLLDRGMFGQRDFSRFGVLNACVP